MVFMLRIERVPVIQEIPERRAAILRLNGDLNVVKVAVRKHLQPVCQSVAPIDVVTTDGTPLSATRRRGVPSAAVSTSHLSR